MKPRFPCRGFTLIEVLVALAIVIRVDIENRQLMRGGRA